MNAYAEDFFKTRQYGSFRSAEIIVPLVLDLVSPKSVIDIGCGVGTWLSVFQKYGIEDIIGVDGSWVKREMLLIPENNFISHDLEKPFRFDKRFDLVMALEVAEHIHPEYAETFVDTLIGLGPIVLFSAAIPFQIGKHHFNEQWPDYWAKLFEEKDYQVIDSIRRRIWNNDDVEYWYAQNILFFASKDYLENHPILRGEMESTIKTQLSLVHPKMYMLNSTPIRIMLLLPLLNRIFVNIITSSKMRNILRKKFLAR
ncbi:MAG: class I SAM-dependent methyltransferase [Methanotrichaceae archaeon]|nr:class I SAM-dependent methyltransferase [Methanotrichaceae archaeon]